VNVEENVQHLAGAAAAAITIERDPITMTVVFRTEYRAVHVQEGVEELESLERTLYVQVLHIFEGAESSSRAPHRKMWSTEEAARGVLEVLGINLNDNNDSNSNSNSSRNSDNEGNNTCPQ